MLELLGQRHHFLGYKLIGRLADQLLVVGEVGRGKDFFGTSRLNQKAAAPASGAGNRCGGHENSFQRSVINAERYMRFQRQTQFQTDKLIKPPPPRPSLLQYTPPAGRVPPRRRELFSGNAPLAAGPVQP